jgi:hypothetical protein
MGATTLAATGGWLTPRQAFAKARNIVDLIRDDAAKAPIKIHKMRGNVSILEGSGGNIAVMTGADGKVFIDAGITARPPANPGSRQWPQPRSNKAPDQHALALRSRGRQ